ncbi:MAG: hypothetical protein JNM39_13320 [Bdellovibrionaceae bacterium]|nr:hypothetical protein [Pseudobdellovibrionaceae bacterium]
MKSYIAPAIVLFSLNSYSGGVVSNGADHLKKAQTWFLGNAAISACIERGSDYVLSQKEVTEIVQQSFAQWKLYVESKQLKDAWPKNQPFLNFNLKLKPSCQGNESITFFFGVKNARVTESLKNYSDPMGFVNLESFDRTKGLGKGFMWIDNIDKDHKSFLWNEYQQILSLVVHEVGHIYGCDHVGGTIMREDIASFLISANPYDVKFSHREINIFPLRVDANRELFFSFERGVRAIGNTQGNTIAQGTQDLFQRIFKRPLSGQLSMGFVHGTNNDSKLGQLFIGERLPGVPKLQGGVFSIEFDMGSKLDFSTSDNKVFHTITSTQEFSFEIPGFVVLGKMVIDKVTGESVTVTYARNRGADEYIRLKFHDNAKGTQEFFRAFIFDQDEGY